MFGSCVRCGHGLVWQSDFMGEDIGYSGCENSLVSYFTCSNCGSHYEVITDCDGCEKCEGDESIVE